MPDPYQNQVDTNYAAFKKLLPELLATHPGQYALMHDAQVVAFFDTAPDAHTAGHVLFSDRPFSVQRVDDSKVNLGFFSYACS